jgi:hypothetical protein
VELAGYACARAREALREDAVLIAVLREALPHDDEVAAALAGTATAL